MNTDLRICMHAFRSPEPCTVTKIGSITSRFLLAGVLEERGKKNKDQKLLPTGRINQALRPETSRACLLLPPTMT
jgi:hypothetical protein